MICMSRGIDVKAIAEVLGEKEFDPVWFSYNFAGGWGSRLTKYRKKGIGTGYIASGVKKKCNIDKFKDLALKNDFGIYAGFYTGILCFYGEKLWDKFIFVDEGAHSLVNHILKNFKCPTEMKDDLYTICHSKYDFEAFVRAAAMNDELSFDPDSIIAVYRLQGDAAIFQLLCQMFYINRGVERLNACLIDGLIVDLPVDVSDYFSGCVFPVIVSPKVDEFKWDMNVYGWFLYGKYDDEWRVVDTAGVGRVVLANHPLNNRLNYLSGGGEVLPYLVCWNWGDIIEAYHYFDSDLLVRDLRNTLFDHYWFNFGPDSKICIRSRGGLINRELDNQVPFPADGQVNSPVHRNIYLIINLLGYEVGVCEKDDVTFSDSEVKDILEIGQLLK